MPGTRHRSGNELLQDEPEFARRLLRLAGLDLARGEHLVPEPTNGTDGMLSNDLDPGTVLVAGPVDQPKRVIIVEFQLVWDPSRLRQWSRYAAAKWLRYECPVQLLVICPDSTADRNAGPIPTSLDGYTHWPTILRPERVPVLASAVHTIADPAMGVMSVAYHGADEMVVSAFAAGILCLRSEQAKRYYEYGLSLSPEIVRKALHHLMVTKFSEPFSKLGLTYYGQGREDGLKAGREQELVEAERGTVLTVLKARGLQVSDSHRTRIDACDDLATLKGWAEAALTAATADDLFK
jgi:hypothetical protein